MELLRPCLPFANGVASHDTFGRVLALLNAAVFGVSSPGCGPA
jgi:hypothetical protein